MAHSGDNPESKGSGMPEPDMMVSSEAQAMMEGKRVSAPPMKPGKMKMMGAEAMTAQSPRHGH